MFFFGTIVITELYKEVHHCKCLMKGKPFITKRLEKIDKLLCSQVNEFFNELYSLTEWSLNDEIHSVVLSFFLYCYTTHDLVFDGLPKLFFFNHLF